MTLVRIKKRLWKKARATRGLRSRASHSRKWIPTRPSLFSQSHRWRDEVHFDNVLNRGQRPDYEGFISSSEGGPRTPTRAGSQHLLTTTPTSTPRRQLLRPEPSSNWSTRSAPADLESARARLFSTPTRSRRVPPGPADDEVEKTLRKPLPAAQRGTGPGTGKVGYNYFSEVIPSHDPAKTLVKIGFTTRTKGERLRQISRTCRHLSVVAGADPEDVMISLYPRAEALIKAELRDRLYDPKCRCAVATRKPPPRKGQHHYHREYFDVDVAIAREVTQRWRAFCEARPYDAKGNLRKFWGHRLAHLKQLRDTTRSGASSSPPPPPLRNGDDDDGELFESRRAQWARFVSPSTWEIYRFWLRYNGGKVWQRGGHTVSFFLALYIAVTGSLGSWLSLVLLAVLSMCICFVIVVDEFELPVSKPSWQAVS
ncbi:hypothetical protein F4778DRAFT_554629 [Xylariomycetidae sp. FL2044]|nr:hypothetical protein F4778DRAFT_554629 [Xylariomycetidae sp. FL2044]